MVNVTKDLLEISLSDVDRILERVLMGPFVMEMRSVSRDEDSFDTNAG